MANMDYPESTTSSIEPHPPGLLRRLGAILYDSTLLLGVLIAAAAGYEAGANALGLEVDPSHPLYRLYLLAVIYLFFTYFWVKGGQTLGMRAWRLKVVRENGSALTWREASLRFSLSILSWLACGLGFLWVLIPPAHLAWHDRLSSTYLVLLKKENP